MAQGMEARMPQVAVAAAAYYAAGAAAEYAAFSLLYGAVATSVISAAAGALVTYAGSALLNDGSETGVVPPQATNTTVRQAAGARRLIYGEIKSGGILIYPGQSTDGDAHLVMALGEGEVDSIDPVFWLGEDLSTDGKFSGLLTFEAHTGAANQAASAALIAAMPGDWTADHRLRGVAYAYDDPLDNAGYR
jgi:hypothetical protein